MHKWLKRSTFLLGAGFVLAACGDTGTEEPVDPETEQPEEGTEEDVVDDEFDEDLEEDLEEDE